MKVPSKIWLMLILGLPLMSPAQKCSVSTQDKNLLATLSKGNLNFALNMYKSLANKENLFFSPFSVSVALAMTAAGAGGSTLTQMNDVLNLNEFTDANQINQAFLSLLDSICSNSNYTLSTANKLFLQNDFPILKPYLDTVTKFYKSSAENVDFLGDTNGVAAQINAWVEKETANNIKNLFPPGSIDPSTILVLVNAIYFKGTWQKRFELENTKPEDFTLSNGQTVSAPMMNIKERFKYAKSETLNSQILQLDYAGDRLVMYIILPDQNNGLARLQQQLTPDAFESLRQQLSEDTVTVKIPKFRLNFRQKINQLLQDLGMTELFNRGTADLTGIGNGNLYVTDVIHQAFVDVDEKGTTAAAATGVSITVFSLMPPPPKIISFIADHPFIFVIFDTAANQILFMGNVDNPKV